jgi:predicted nucleic acid-binding protein
MALIGVDAGILIAVLDAHDAHHDPAVQHLRAARARGDRLMVPVSAYAEAMVRPAAAGPDAQARLDRLLDDLVAEVEPATRSIGRRAAELRARHVARLRLPDALVLATALEVGADTILTTDARWPEAGITVVVVTSDR